MSLHVHGHECECLSLQRHRSEKQKYWWWLEKQSQITSQEHSSWMWADISLSTCERGFHDKTPRWFTTRCNFMVNLKNRPKQNGKQNKPVEFYFLMTQNQPQSKWWIGRCGKTKENLRPTWCLFCEGSRELWHWWFSADGSNRMNQSLVWSWSNWAALHFLKTTPHFLWLHVHLFNYFLHLNFGTVLKGLHFPHTSFYTDASPLTLNLQPYSVLYCISHWMSFRVCRIKQL